MFNLWQRVHDEGKDVILAHADELSSLDMYEVEELFPKLVPIDAGTAMLTGCLDRLCGNAI